MGTGRPEQSKPSGAFPPERPQAPPVMGNAVEPRDVRIAASPVERGGASSSGPGGDSQGAAPASGPVPSIRVTPAAAEAKRPAEKTASPEAESGEDTGPLDAIKETAIENAPPWLVSLVVHMCILVVLAALVLPMLPDDQIVLDATPDYAEKLGDDLEFDDSALVTSIDPSEQLMLTPEDLLEVEDPFAAPPDLAQETLTGTSAISEIESSLIGLSLDGRQEGSREQLLRQGGGTGLTEDAVKRALAWLAKNQQRDGSWSLKGPYDDGADRENRVAATAMALLAFQGHGETPVTGKHKTNVARGWAWLLAQQGPDGCFVRDVRHQHWFYTQAQATIAVCELYGMTKDEAYREPAALAVDYCVRSQGPEGGWKYSPQQEVSDLSVTGWVLMALQSARMAKLEVPPDVLRRVTQFLDDVAVEGGSRYCYMRGRRVSLAMTAEGLLCRQYLGWSQDDPRLKTGLDWITRPENLVRYEKGEEGLSERDVYYWYYATQAAHHMGGEHWKRWNMVMRQRVPENQVRSGREAGSWDPKKPVPDAWANEGGRLYVTCLSTYMLEVYYRHMPLYWNPFVAAPLLDIPEPVEP